MFIQFILISLLLCNSFAFALEYDVEEMEVYQPDKNFQMILLKMDFGQWSIKNPDTYELVGKGKKIEEVDIVFTLYPFGLLDWRKEYRNLLQNRVEALAKIAPELISCKETKFRLVLQTSGNTESAARKLFHGIVLKYKDAAGHPRKVWSYSMLDQENDSVNVEALSNEVNNMVYGFTPFADSTVLKVVARNNWKSMTVVTDWTGSMYQHGAQMVNWHRIHLDSNRIHGYVFFNDGNRKKTKQKIIGRTGGVIFCQPPTIDSLLSIMKFLMKMGQGGDIPENNMEALLKGIRHGKIETELVMIADNQAPVRDMRLLNKINRPVRIILCGTFCGTPIHPHYIEIARYTKGSIHTIEQDIHDIYALKAGHYYEINGVKYKKAKGKLVKR